MATFRFGVRIPAPQLAYDSAALGVSAATKLADIDVGKVVKLAGNNNYILAVATDNIEGVLTAIDASTVNAGFSFGTVLRRPVEFEAVNGGAATIAVGAQVVSGAQAAVATANGTINTVSYQLPVVQAGTGTLGFFYRVKSHLGGTGAVGSVILVEKC